MKYNANNKPLVCMQTQSRCYRNTYKMDIKGVLWHSTGANNPNIKRYVQPSDVKPTEDTYTKEEWLKILGKNTNGNDWNHIEKSVGLNCWIGKLADGSVTTVQTMPWNYRPWGCGGGSKGSCNNGWIQFEICEDGLNDKNYFDKIYKEACEITAYLCDMYHLDPYGTVNLNGVKVPVILCHKDSSYLGLGSNHGDVYHWFNKYGKDMDDVRRDVAALMKTTATPITPAPTITSDSGLKFKVGDIVNFAGGKHYGSTNAISGSNVKASKAKVTAVSKNGKHPYHLRAVNDKGAFISGVYGWVDASAVSAIAEDSLNPVSPAPAPAPTPSTATITNGTKLVLKNVALYASSSAVTKSATRSGAYYVWSKDIINNRIRITNSTTNVGKSGKVTGWISYADAKNSVDIKTTQKSIDDWANEVINGEHGNGSIIRTISLKKAGCPYTYKEVQSRVNEMIK